MSSSKVADFLKSPAFMVGVFVTLAVAAGAVFLIAFLSREPAALLQVCWGPDGRAHYGASELEALDERSPCAEYEAFVWPQGDTLMVAAIDASGTPLRAQDVEELVSAIDLVNDQLGVSLVWIESPREADILVSWHAPVELGGGVLGRSPGYCVHHKVGNRVTAEMAVRTLGSSRTEHRAAVHELGHCLGLAHHPSGIMQPVVADDTADSRLDFTMFADDQRGLMRVVYP